MNSNPSSLVPFVGEAVACRDSSERLNEEVYRSIPALTHFANAAVEVGNKLAADAREALFFDKGRDPELRALMVETAMVKRDEMGSVQPDLEWLRSASPANRKDFETKDNDLWIGPAGPEK